MKRRYHTKEFVRKWWDKRVQQESLEREHPYYFKSSDPNDWDKFEV